MKIIYFSQHSVSVYFRHFLILQVDPPDVWRHFFLVGVVKHWRQRNINELGKKRPLFFMQATILCVPSLCFETSLSINHTSNSGIPRTHITEKYLQHVPTGTLGPQLYNVFQPHEYIEHTGRHKTEETPLRLKVRRLLL